LANSFRVECGGLFLIPGLKQPWAEISKGLRPKKKAEVVRSSAWEKAEVVRSSVWEKAEVVKAFGLGKG
jgi:hypothetical protein